MDLIRPEHQQKYVFHQLQFVNQFNLESLSPIRETSITSVSAGHLCFNITEKGQVIVPDRYNRILHYTRKYGENYVFQ